MIIRKVEFLTVANAAVYLMGQDFRQDDAGKWHRPDDGATAEIRRLSFSVPPPRTPGSDPV